MIILNYAWDISFARIDGNKKAILERGWYPYNRNLLLHPELVDTMTKKEQESAVVNNYVGPKNIMIQNDAPNYDPKFLSATVTETETNSISQGLNYSRGVASFCAHTLIGHQSLMERRAKMKEKVEVREKL